MSTLTESR